MRPLITAGRPISSADLMTELIRGWWLISYACLTLLAASTCASLVGSGSLWPLKQVLTSSRVDEKLTIWPGDM